MHRGCFVSKPTPPPSGRRTPRPGPARVCVWVPCLAGSGGLASWARSGAPHLSFGRSLFALCLFGPLRAGVALFVVVVGFSVFLFPFPPLVPPSLCPTLRVFWPRVPWALASCPPHAFFFGPPPLIVPCISSFPVARGPGPLFLVFPFPVFFFAGCAVRGGFVCLWPSGVPACASVVLSLSLLTVRWLVLRGVRCWARLSSAISWWVLVLCFGGAVLVWPRGSPPCCSAWCVLVFRCPVLCCVGLCSRVMVCCRALPFVCVVACARCFF